MGARGVWLVLLAALFSGCETASYYSQAIHGQCQILQRQRPIATVLAEANAPPELKEKLRLVLQLREFAESELKLPVNGHYLRYADLGRRFAVWNVTAAPEFSLEPKRWWYPVVGRVDYRGFFAEADARRCAAKLHRGGYDVHVGGVPAYSTLGWFHDPVLNTFTHEPEDELAELLFHELAHQRLFASGDTDFSEAFAQAVAEEGTKRWLLETKGATVCESYRAKLARKDQFAQLASAARSRLDSVFAEGLPPDAMRAAKARVLDETARDYAQLKSTWNGHDDFADWFRFPLNNARLNSLDTYYGLLPAFEGLLRKSGGDLAAFYQEADRLAKVPKSDRHRQLAMAANGGAGATAPAAPPSPGQ
jgi:predicted aminopeptidase